MNISLNFMPTRNYSGITWIGEATKKSVKTVFEDLNLYYSGPFGIDGNSCFFESYNLEEIQVVAELLGFVKQPSTFEQRLALRWQEYEPLTNEDKHQMDLNVALLFDPTVQLLKRLGHHVYVGIEDMNDNLRDYVQSRDQQASQHGFELCSGRCASLTNGKTFIYIRDESYKHILWHEAWHSLQFSHDPNKDKYWMIEDQCSILPDDFIQDAINRFFNKYSNYTLDDISKELPALAVEKHPEFVMSILESLL